jgi:hypothetical protein
MKIALTSFVVIVSLGVTASAHAQERRPYRGLFAGGVDGSEQLLTASASLGTGWDQNLVADFNGRNRLTPGDGPLQTGAVTGSATLAYSLRRSTTTLSASAGGSAYYYPRISRRLITREYFSASGEVGLPYGFSAYGAARYQPYSLRNLFGSDYGFSPYDPAASRPYVPRNMFVTAFDGTAEDGTFVDFPASREHYFSQSGGVAYRRRLTQRRTFSAGYDYQHRSRGALGEYRRQRAGAHLSQQVSRGLSLRIGYGYSDTWYGADAHFAHHNIDAGIDYGRALSLSRRTSVSFGTGTSASRSDRENSLRFRMSGSAHLSHEIARTWGAMLSYSRGLRFSESWPEPLFSDVVSAGMGGLINRRTQLQLGAQAMHGSGYTRRRGGAEAYSAGASLSVAVTRYVNTGVMYAYYRHAFGESIALGPGFPREFDGQTIRVSVTVWAPLYQRARRP